MKKGKFILLIPTLVLFLSSTLAFADVDIHQCRERVRGNDPEVDLESCVANCTDSPDSFCHQETDNAGETTTYCCPPEAKSAPSAPLGKIKLPGFLNWTKAHPGISGINLLINNLVKLIFIIASVGLFIMFSYGGLRFILSQGDKAQTEAARNTITNAIIGFAIVALSFALVRIVETFFGIGIINWPPGRTNGNPCPPDGFNLGGHAICRTECEDEGIGDCEGTWCCPH